MIFSNRGFAFKTGKNCGTPSFHWCSAAFMVSSCHQGWQLRILKQPRVQVQYRQAPTLRQQPAQVFPPGAA
jgi:lipoprotein